MVSQAFPNIAATSFGGNVPTAIDQAGFVAPGVPQLAPMGLSAQQGAFANLDAANLQAMIDQFNARLSRIDEPTMRANIENQKRVLEQQQAQFAQQQFFNEQAQRAQELQAFRGNQFNYDQMAQIARTAEGARSTTQMLGNYQNATQAVRNAQDEALERQRIATTGYTAYDQARQAQQAHAVNVANTIASLRGPSNAFKQLEVNGYLNATGAGSLLGALAGETAVPSYRGMGGTPEAATLQTMARDAGAAPGAYSYLGDDAGVRGLLQVAGQNASFNPGDSRTYAMNLDQVAQDNILAAQGVLGSEYGPRSTVGSKVIQGYKDLLVKRGVDQLPYDDPDVVALWRNTFGGTQAQALAAAKYATDYYTTYGTQMDGSMINEMVGQISAGQAPDLTKWSEGARAKIPGYGTPNFRVPGQPAPGQPAPIPPGGARDNPGAPLPPLPGPGQPGYAPPYPGPNNAPGGAVPWDAAGPRPGTTPPRTAAVQQSGQPVMQRGLLDAPTQTGAPVMQRGLAPAGPTAQIQPMPSRPLLAAPTQTAQPAAQRALTPAGPTATGAPAASAPLSMVAPKATGVVEAGTGYQALEGGGYRDPMSGKIWRNGAWT